MPVEEEGHHPIPTGEPFYGSKDQALVWLCPTTHSAVHACIRMYLKAQRSLRLPYPYELRPYTRFVRNLALVAMDALGAQADIPLDPEHGKDGQS